jgi:hypothetical protein
LSTIIFNLKTKKEAAIARTKAASYPRNSHLKRGRILEAMDVASRSVGKIRYSVKVRGGHQKKAYG